MLFRSLGSQGAPGEPDIGSGGTQGEPYPGNIESFSLIFIDFLKFPDFEAIFRENIFESDFFVTSKSILLDE